MFLGGLLPFRQWLATGQATHATYGNEGLWFIHSWFGPRPVCLLLNYVRIELPSSIQGCCGVLGQLCWQLTTFVSSCIHGARFSLRVSLTVTGPGLGLQRSETSLVFLRPPLIHHEEPLCNRLIPGYQRSPWSPCFTCYNLPQFNAMLEREKMFFWWINPSELCFLI